MSEEKAKLIGIYRYPTNITKYSCEEFSNGEYVIEPNLTEGEFYGVGDMVTVKAFVFGCVMP